MAVMRCVCRGTTFADALEAARRHGSTTVAELQRHVDLGTGCGLCVPYMQRVLITGVTDQPVLSIEEMDELRRVALPSGKEVEK